MIPFIAMNYIGTEAIQGVEFYTDKPVRIRTKTELINGIGMEASQDFKEHHIIQVTGILKVGASQFPN